MSVSNTVVPVAATWSHPRTTLGSSEQHLENDQEFTLKVNCASRSVPHNIPPFTLLSPTSPLQKGRICGVEGLDRVALDGHEGDVCDRPDVSHLRLPRQTASANGATTPGFSGPFPSQCVDAAHAVTRVPFCAWQLGSFLFGMPARGPSCHLLVGFRVAALDSVRHCKVAGGH